MDRVLFHPRQSKLAFKIILSFNLFVPALLTCTFLESHAQSATIQGISLRSGKPFWSLLVTPQSTPTPSPSPVIMDFSDTSYSVAENAGSISITVIRSGDASIPATVDYSTYDMTASHLSDYNLEWGTLRFAVGETSKTFTIFITDDAYVEGNETVALALTNPTGGAPFLGLKSNAVLTIMDNDTVQPATNPIDDARFFVRQQYVDFLNREPDQGGQDYWVGQIVQCGSDTACVTRKRSAVSAAFFVEQEFQQAGYFVYRLYLATQGSQPAYPQYVRGRTQIIGGSNLASSQAAFASEVVNPAYDGLSNEAYVDQLFSNAGLTPSGMERAALVNGLNSNPPAETRVSVLIKVANNQTLEQREYNPAFVLAQYFNYLQRDPDAAGYQFWLNVLNNREPNNYRGMVCAFITSEEYQRRFSPFISHSNSECGL